MNIKIQNYTIIFLVLFFINFDNVVSFRIADLSYSIGKSTQIWPGHRKYEKFADKEGKSAAADGNWIAENSYIFSEHTSTHMDAPIHYKENHMNLHEIPMTRLLHLPGVKVDISHKVFLPDGRIDREYGATKEDFLAWERKNGKIPPNACVFVRTGWDTKWGNGSQDFLGNTKEEPLKTDHPGIGGSGAKFLGDERFIFVLGVDTVSLDPGVLTSTSPTHVHLSYQNVVLIENVANLRSVPDRGFTVYIFPLRLTQDATGSPVRIYALF